MNDIVEFALQYAARSWFVFPCEPRGKKPLVKHGFKDASTDQAQIEAWWGGPWPDANIGLATGKSGLVVLDVDGTEGLAELQALIAEHGPLPRTLCAKTGRPSGVHIYFVGAGIKSSQMKGSKLDVRGSTGYVILPPSIHENGNVYGWINALAPIAAIPDWLKEWANNRKSGTPGKPASPMAQSHPLGRDSYRLGRRRNLAERSIAAQAAVPFSTSEAARLRSALAVIDAAIDGGTWASYGMALHDLKWFAKVGPQATVIDVGFELWDEWSKTSTGTPETGGAYEGREKMWRRWINFGKEINGARVTVASIFAAANAASTNPQPDAQNINGHDSLPNLSQKLVGTTAPPIFWPDAGPKNKPKATCRNARVAIRHLGLTCEHDTFHDKLIIGGEPIGEWAGELTDNAVHMLRVTIEHVYNFDPGSFNARDAAVQECLQAGFDPICDYLEALKWDGTARLRGWLPTYMNAANTPLNQAIGSLVLVAAVRRARQPGAKFDQITVFISDEGRGKSQAIEILAGSENFSDQSILTLDDRAQQEAMQGIWLYEIADLAGIGKADVEKVKAFASRRSDRARPAYGRTRLDRPRRCIIFATTNHQTFLKAQTGNRRFWPVEVGKIDIEGLSRDRDQLWAEAAAIEARGVPLQLPEMLWGEATRLQSERTDSDPWDDLLSSLAGTLVKLPDGTEERRIRSRDILEMALKIPSERMTDVTAKRVAFTMRRLGWDGPKSFRDGVDIFKGFSRAE